MHDIFYPPRAMSAEQKRAFILACAESGSVLALIQPGTMPEVDRVGTVSDTVRTDQQHENIKMLKELENFMDSREGAPVRHIRDLCALPKLAARVFERLDAGRVKYSARLAPSDYVPDAMVEFYGEECREFWALVCAGEWETAATYPGQEWMFQVVLPDDVAGYIDEVRGGAVGPAEGSGWAYHFTINRGADSRRRETGVDLHVLRATDHESMEVVCRIVTALHFLIRDEYAAQK